MAHYGGSSPRPQPIRRGREHRRRSRRLTSPCRVPLPHVAHLRDPAHRSGYGHPCSLRAGQYERNLARLAANRARAESPRAPREGPALLGGLVASGICGHRLQVNYETSGQGLTGRYCCQRRHDNFGEPRCQQMAARFLDDHVVAQVLSALAPAALELAVTAARQIEDRRAEIGRIWRQRLERAAFACDRARRQYQLAEPEHRLVTRQLEREWEAALAERAHLGEKTSGTSGSARPGCRPPNRSCGIRHNMRGPRRGNAPGLSDEAQFTALRYFARAVGGVAAPRPGTARPLARRTPGAQQATTARQIGASGYSVR